MHITDPRLLKTSSKFIPYGTIVTVTCVLFITACQTKVDSRIVEEANRKVQTHAEEAERSAKEAKTAATQSQISATQAAASALTAAQELSPQVALSKAQLAEAQAAEAQKQSQMAAVAAANANLNASLVRKYTSKISQSQNKADIRIYNIGNSNILIFEKNEKNPEATSDLIIPVMGMGFTNEKTKAVIGLEVTGTVPVTHSDYTFSLDLEGVDGPTNNCFEIILKNKYIQKLKTGDHLDVVVMANAVTNRSNPDSKNNYGDLEPLSCAQRIFTFYSVEDYRKVSERRIPINDIQAFPLPESEATDLFGPVIAKNFFVVKLTLRNNDLSADERLVNVGMISATGRLLVEPVSKDEPSFTLPVKISPQSTTHVFAVLEAKEEDSPRSFTFRTLEFAGALSSAYLFAFPQGKDAAPAVALATGVALPELRKLWPDKWPAYKRNLVNFGMPDLVKVPKSASTTPKFIFFSKNDLELVLSEPTIMPKGATTDPKGLRNKAQIYFRRIMKGDGQPAVHVLSLAFDGLDIPFENVFTPSETDLREEVMTLLADQSVFKEQLENIKARWNSGYITPEINIANSFTTTKNALTKILDTQTPPANSLGTVDPASATDPKATNDAKTLVVLKAHCTELNALVTTISSINNEQTNELYRAVVTEKNGGATLANIETVNNQLSVIQQRLLSGGDITTLKTKVTSIKDRIAHTKEIIDFTETAAQQLSTKELNDYLKELGDATETDAAAFIKKHGKAIDSVNQVYETLKASRTVKIVPDFDPDGYKAMK